MRTEEALLHRVQRRGADVAEHDADRAEHGLGKRLALSIVKMRGFIGRPLRPVGIDPFIFGPSLLHCSNRPLRRASLAVSHSGRRIAGAAAYCSPHSWWIIKQFCCSATRTMRRGLIAREDEGARIAIFGRGDAPVAVGVGDLAELLGRGRGFARLEQDVAIAVVIFSAQFISTQSRSNICAAAGVALGRWRSAAAARNRIGSGDAALGKPPDPRSA